MSHRIPSYFIVNTDPNPDPRALSSPTFIDFFFFLFPMWLVGWLGVPNRKQRGKVDGLGRWRGGGKNIRVIEVNRNE